MSLKYIWYGHGTMGLETNGHKIVIDPFFTGNPAASTTAEAVEADFIIVSHGHGDHIADAVAIGQRTGALTIANFEIINWLGSQGLEKLHPQHIGGGFKHPFGYLKLTHALHGSGLPDGSYGGNPAGLLLTTHEGQKVYLACDTGLFASMKLIGEEGIDLAVLPIGDNFTMGPDDALRAVKLLNPKHVIPAHYNTWPLIEQDAAAWAARVEKETDAKAHVLQPGESFEL
ncbi:MAG: metal-dependent hydrolase [Chloroflexi bacterium]|jgi:L-ascorbate metabolism protein UlaG (beta-lactamase superfamily)|nr:metal-dependent hydrolase [Chloroflexota bacterium]